MQAINIFLITSHFPPKRGGVETTNLRYLDFFERQKNIQVTVLTYENRYGAKFHDYWKKSKVIRIRVPAPLLDFMIGLKSVSRLNSPFKMFLYFFLHTGYLIAESIIHLRELLRADKILVNGALVESFTGYVLSALTKKKYCVSWCTDLSSNLANIAIKLCLKRAFVIRVNGEDIKEKLVNLTGIDETKVFVTKYSVDTQIFYPVPQIKARTILNLPSERFIILFAAAFNQFKFCDLIVNSIPSLFQKKESDFFFIFIGEGPLDCAIEGLQKSYKSNILFMNHFVSHETLNLYINASDIIIGSADIYYASKVVFESLACGTPVLIFNTSGHVEKRRGKLKFKIPLPHVFLVHPSQDELCTFLINNKSKINQMRNNTQLIEMSRRFISQNHGPEKLTNEIMPLIK